MSDSDKVTTIKTEETTSIVNNVSLETTPTTDNNTTTNNKRSLESEESESNKKVKTEESEEAPKQPEEDDDEEEDEDELDKLNDETKVDKKRANNKPPPIRPPKLLKEELIELQNKTKVTTDESRKKKVAIILGYSGTNYIGMQKNPGLNTIEEELEHALFRTGGISPDNMYYQQKVDWVRCARTDKGVSAIRNVVSLKMECGPPDFDGMKAALNKELPNDIRVFHIMRVNNSFHAKNAVDARSYIYVTPTHVFEPKFSKSYQSTESFKFTPEHLVILNRVLSFFVGNHRFHNYTSRKDSNDTSVFRKIHSFKCSEPFELEGVEMVSMNVIGESFMLHQIRKMVGCLISFMRKGIFQDAENHEEAFKKIKSYIEATFAHKPLNLPMAPGAGLLLDFCIFNLWNEKNKDAHGELKIENEEVEEFKKTIYKEIALFESTKSEFKNWIEKNLDPYPLQYQLLEEIIANPPTAPPKRPKISTPQRLGKKERREQKVNSRKFELDKQGGGNNSNNNNTTTATTDVTSTTSTTTIDVATPTTTTDTATAASTTL